MMFVHGGSWRSGDRSLYRALGIHFAHAGIAVAIPSYRLMPQNPHPAQIEDVAAAFAWTYREYRKSRRRFEAFLPGRPFRGRASGGIARVESGVLEQVRHFAKSDSRRRGDERSLRCPQHRGIRVTAGDRNQASPLALATSASAPRFCLPIASGITRGFPNRPAISRRL